MRRILALATMLVATVTLAAGCAADPEEEGARADDATPTEGDEGAASSVESELYGCNQCSNCVDYARCRMPSLPHGLTSYADKRARINSQTARGGCVAVINTGSYYGHVAYVRSVSGSRIYIDEGNWPSGRCGQRSGTRAALNIAGFICR